MQLIVRRVGRHGYRSRGRRRFVPDCRFLTAPVEHTGSPERDAVGLLRAAWAPEYPDIKVPVDPIRIARGLGIKVLTGKLPESVAGVVRKKPGEDPEIYLNGRDSPARQRFSCALALGHYVSRATSGENSWEFVETRSPDDTTDEGNYAYAFAAALCMPTEAVLRLMSEKVPVAEMAYRFGVSVEVMQKRVEKFG
jgi:hypothetical protein